jgi:prevent-host-death family protein
MKTIPAGEFKARCLKLMDRVRETREPVLITKRGVPVAKLVPVEDSSRGILGCMAGTIEIVGDIVSPLTSPEDWDALR